MTIQALLWIDCVAGAIVGAAVLAFSGPLSRLEGVPREVLSVLAVANLLYACYSFSLALNPRRSRRTIELLVFANSIWAVICVVLAVVFAEAASPFGLAHLLGEATFVGVLARAEWVSREERNRR